MKIGHENPIKAIIYQWLLPHFQYRNLMRYVRFISWGETQTRRSQGTLTLSYQQAAILNKPVGGKIWLRKDGYISRSTSLLITALMNESCECASANSETLLHPTDRWLQRLPVPDERLPHIQTVQLGHGLLGQDRWRRAKKQTAAKLLALN